MDQQPNIERARRAAGSSAYSGGLYRRAPEPETWIARSGCGPMSWAVMQGERGVRHEIVAFSRWRWVAKFRAWMHSRGQRRRPAV